MTATDAHTAGASTFQQEVDVLRGQIGTLGVVGLWTSKNPPKLAGIYGQLLQGLEAGESLIRAFTRLHMASEANRTNAYNILKLVQAYDAKIEKQTKKANK